MARSVGLGRRMSARQADREVELLRLDSYPQDAPSRSRDLTSGNLRVHLVTHALTLAKVWRIRVLDSGAVQLTALVGVDRVQ